MPAVLRRVSDAKCSEIEVAAVAIKSVREDQRHVGIAFREGEQQCALLHLRWHCLPLKEKLDVSFYWVQPSVDPIRLNAIIAFCDLVDRTNPYGIPYGFDAPNDCFDTDTGRALLGPSGRGLTCSTFVLAVFQAVGIYLLNFESWQSRESDIKWQQWIIGQLEGRADLAHMDAVRAQVGATRALALPGTH